MWSVGEVNRSESRRCAVAGELDRWKEKWKTEMERERETRVREIVPEGERPREIKERKKERKIKGKKEEEKQ